MRDLGVRRDRPVKFILPDGMAGLAVPFAVEDPWAAEKVASQLVRGIAIDRIGGPRPVRLRQPVECKRPGRQVTEGPANRPPQVIRGSRCREFHAVAADDQRHRVRLP